MKKFLCTFLLLLTTIFFFSERANSDPVQGTGAEMVENILEKVSGASDETIKDKVENLTTDLQNIFTALIEKKKLEAPWRKKWEESLNNIKQIQENVKKLASDFENKRSLLSYIEKAKQNFSELMPSVNRYKKWAALMEAISSRLSHIEQDVKRELAPLYINHENMKRLQASTLALSSYTINIKLDNAEYQAYQKDIQETQTRIEKILEQQKADLATADHVLEEIGKAREEIEKNLPELWKNYYLQRPIPWLDVSSWTYLPRQIDVMFSGLEMRRSLDLPTDTNGWRMTLLRGLISLLLFTAAILVLRRQSWLATDTNPTLNHIFKISAPLICLGLSFLISSFSANGECFRMFLAIGNIFIILGQIHLAWDLRVFSSTNTPNQSAPLLRLFPLTCVAYVLLYLPLLPIVLLLLWFFSLLAVLIWRRFWPELDIGNLSLEKGLRTFDGIVLWLCLLLTCAGLPILSMIVYLCCVSTSLASELCFGGVDSINYLNNNLPSEGIRAIISNIVVSLAAPILMLIAVSSVLLWVATLPGGMTLLQEYLFKNVSVGSAEFNFVNVLIIISAFFLTKAIVKNGSRYLSRVITSRKGSIDTTLVTPAQTAFTYVTWLIFALFVMHMLQIDLKNAAMVMTGLSVGIGMGLQSIVNNLFSGLLLIFGRMLQVGDVIEVGGISGRVASISVRHTLIKTYDNAHIYVPNSEFISGHLVNWSRHDTTVRASVSVGVAYGSNTDDVIRILKTIVGKQENILRYPEPAVVFQQFGDNALEFSVFFWVNNFDDRIKTCTAVRLQIEKEFSKNNIEIAYPQLDVHVKQNNQSKLQAIAEARARRSRLPVRRKGILRTAAKSRA